MTDFYEYGKDILVVTIPAIMGFSDKGQVGINEKGDAVAENKRSMADDVPVGSDSIGTKVIRASEKKDDTSKDV